MANKMAAANVKPASTGDIGMFVKFDWPETRSNEINKLIRERKKKRVIWSVWHVASRAESRAESLTNGDFIVLVSQKEEMKNF